MSQVVLPPNEAPHGAGLRAGGWWREHDGRVVCDLCPRSCSLRPGDRGFCFVRQNLEGRMVLTTYGRSTGFCIDPIEKKPLYHFYPGSSVLSFGTAGCNLGCKFCQNWESTRSREVDAACALADPEAVAEAAVEHACRSVAFTYNDPIVWAEYAIDTARACRAAGVKTVAVTSGYIRPPARETFFEFMDAANVDLKGFSEDFYVSLCGGHLEPVLDTLRWLKHQTGVWLEITNLVIPQANDDAGLLRQMCDWIAKELGADVPLHFSAFHPDFRMTDRGPTPLPTLLAAHRIAVDAGLRYVYVGNVSSPKQETTYCPGCGQAVIRRSGYAMSAYEIAGGACRACGAKLPGHFDERPGTWGSRRQPIAIRQRAPAAPTALAAPAAQAQGKPQLASAEEQRVLDAASKRVAAAVLGNPGPQIEALLGSFAATPVYGAFVSLKRSGQLRSCCGFMGQSVPLAEAINHAAFRAATDDPRFPPISPSELEHLDIEVWLLWGLQPMKAKGDQRVQAVEIGRHGLQIARGANRGLLLPGVAVEHKLDAKHFLEQVCLKAGLPANAWRQDDTHLWTFDGYAIHGRLGTLLAGESREPAARPTPAELAALANYSRSNLLALSVGATPSFYLPGGYDGSVCGVTLLATLPGSNEQVHCGTVGLRADRPLQSTLYGLTEALAGALRNRGVDPRGLESMPLGLIVLSDPAMHGSADAPDLKGIDPARRALLAVDRVRTAWLFDPKQTADELLAGVLRLGKFPEAQSTSVFSLAAASTAPRASAAYSPQPQQGPEVRPPAVAGAFYPGSKAEINRALDQMLADPLRPEFWAGAMVPHAGWVYSGRLAAATLGRVQIPEQVIVICPKHRPGGADWAVAPHRTWSLPEMQIPSDPDLAARLAAAIEGLELDALAHRQEHAIEVQLPILARLAPGARVVGISVGGGELASLERFADQLAGVLRPMNPRPLLVVSTDMNHYADLAATESLDQMALEAIRALDPRRLFEVVGAKQISMCGMRPAVIVMETLRRLGALNCCEMVGYTTSAEASGDRARVVGYAGVLWR